MKRLLPILMVFGVFLGSVVPEQTYAFGLGWIFDPIRKSAKEAAKEAAKQNALNANKAMLLDTKECPEYDLSGADLAGTNLQNANLRNALLIKTNLEGANGQSDSYYDSGIKPGSFDQILQ